MQEFGGEGLEVWRLVNYRRQVFITDDGKSALLRSAHIFQMAAQRQRDNTVLNPGPWFLAPGNSYWSNRFSGQRAPALTVTIAGQR